MIISKQLLVALILLFGMNLAAKGGSKSPKRIYKITACDCLGEQDGIPTFLSDISRRANIKSRSKSLAKAEAMVNRKCQKIFRKVDKTSRIQAAATGCRKHVTIAGSGRWREF